jgi:hypothetical protein
MPGPADFLPDLLIELFVRTIDAIVYFVGGNDRSPRH